MLALAGFAARLAGRPADDRLRGRPVRQRRRGRPRVGPGVRARGARGAARTATRRRSSRSAARRWSSGCRPSSTDLDRFASVPATSATDVGGALRLAAGAVPRRHPEADRARQRRQRHHRPRPVRGVARRRARRPDRDLRRSASAPPTRSIVQRVHSPGHRARRRGHRDRGRRSPRPSPSRRPCACSATARRSASSTSTSTPGLNRVVFTTERHRGRLPHLPRASSRPSTTPSRQNNRGDSHTIVKGDPRILLIAGSAGGRRPTSRAALEAENQDVTVVTPEQAPTDLTGFATLRLGRAGRRRRHPPGHASA